MHIAIAGNIGAGKTTLTEMLASHYNWEPHFEDVLKNPYLDDFYERMERWSFNLQIYFLNSRFNQMLECSNNGKNTIQDRTIYEDAYIFAPNLQSMGLMTNRDFENYQSIFNTLNSFVKDPDLLIYLRSGIPNLVDHRRKQEGVDLEKIVNGLQNRFGGPKVVDPFYNRASLVRSQAEKKSVFEFKGKEFNKLQDQFEHIAGLIEDWRQEGLQQ